MRSKHLRRLLRIYFLERRLALVALGAALVALGMNAAIPLVVRLIVKQSIRASRADLLLPLLGFLLFLLIIKATGAFIRKRWAGRLSIALEVRLRNSLYDHVHALDMAFHDKTPTGQLMSRVASDMQRTSHAMGAIPFFTAMSTQLLLVSVILFSVDIPLAALVTCTLPFVVWLGITLSKRLDAPVRATQHQLGEVTSVAEETVGAIRVVKAFGREQHQVEKFTERADQVHTEAMRAIRIRAFSQPMFELLPASLVALVALVGGLRVLDGHLNLSDFLLFAMFATQLALPVRAMGWLVTDFQQAISASARIFEVMDTKPGIADRQGAKELTPTSGALVFEDIAFLAAGRKVLDSLNLTVEGGSSIALVGPTGCGKSTLLRLALRFVEPSAGRVLIDGSDIAGVTLHSLRSSMGTVFEDTFLFSESIASNIAFGRPDATDEEIVQAAVLAQAHSFVEELPEGYDTVVGEQGYTLSGGQRQRIAIARAIMMNPKVLLLDDATSAIDPLIESQIRRGLQEAMRGRTTLIVARRPQSAALADRVAYMEKGRIVAVGSHDELIDRVPAYAAVLGAGRTTQIMAAGA